MLFGLKPHMFVDLYPNCLCSITIFVGEIPIFTGDIPVLTGEISIFWLCFEAASPFQEAAGLRRFHHLSAARRHNETLTQLLALPPEDRAKALATMRAKAVEEEMRAEPCGILWIFMKKAIIIIIVIIIIITTITIITIIITIIRMMMIIIIIIIVIIINCYYYRYYYCYYYYCYYVYIYMNILDIYLGGIVTSNPGTS